MRCTLAALALIGLSFAVGAAEPPPGLAPSADGQELIDNADGHAWARCVEGMRWDGKACQEIGRASCRERVSSPV